MTHRQVMWELPAYGRFCERLAEFSRLILFDKRGMGMSDRVAGATTLETRMDDIRAVMDAVGSERAAVMGESEGGRSRSCSPPRTPTGLGRSSSRAPSSGSAWMRAGRGARARMRSSSRGRSGTSSRARASSSRTGAPSHSKVCPTNGLFALQALARAGRAPASARLARRRRRPVEGKPCGGHPSSERSRSSWSPQGTSPTTSTPGSSPTPAPPSRLRGSPCRVRPRRQSKAPSTTISCATPIGSQTPLSRFESMTTVRSRPG